LHNFSIDEGHKAQSRRSTPHITTTIVCLRAVIVTRYCITVTGKAFTSVSRVTHQPSHTTEEGHSLSASALWGQGCGWPSPVTGLIAAWPGLKDLPRSLSQFQLIMRGWGHEGLATSLRPLGLLQGFLNEVSYNYNNKA